MIPDRLLERVEHEVARQRRGDPPADNAPRENVDHEGHVTEVVFSKLSIRPGDRIEVITHGGWYEEKGGQRVPTRLADIAEGLQRGGEYFVPITHEQRSGTAWRGKKRTQLT